MVPKAYTVHLLFSNCSGPITIYPVYNNSQLTVTEITPDSSERNLFRGFFEHWWITRPCKYCEKVFSQHCQHTRKCGEHKSNPNLVWKTEYVAMDNLTYTEWLAKERGLV